MYQFIVNPKAGNGLAAVWWRRLAGYLDAGGVEYATHLTSAPGDGAEIARSLTEGCKDPQVIVVVGGDGTVGEVLDGLSFYAGLTLGYIPVGARNTLARSRHFPRDPVKALKRILAADHCHHMDYGILSWSSGTGSLCHRRFAVNAGIGLNATVCRDVQEKRSGARCGRMEIMRSGIRNLRRFQPVKGYIVLDGVKRVEFTRIAFISAHIQPYEGGGFRLIPNACDCDGLLSVCVVSHASHNRLLSILIEALLGSKAKRKGMRLYECSELRIHTDVPQPVHSDGEYCGMHTDLQISCSQRKLRIIE